MNIYIYIFNKDYALCKVANFMLKIENTFNLNRKEKKTRNKKKDSFNFDEFFFAILNRRNIKYEIWLFSTMYIVKQLTWIRNLMDWNDEKKNIYLYMNVIIYIAINILKWYWSAVSINIMSSTHIIIIIINIADEIAIDVST